jgi:CheY-like chemotaxis protein
MQERIKHICLAEDDPDDYYIFSNILHEINAAIKLTWFQTCEYLLEYLKAGSDLPCIIVLDMNMPKMDGLKRGT